MNNNKSFFDAGIYITAGFALSQLLYGIIGYGDKAYAAAALSAVVTLAGIAFEMTNRYKDTIK